MFCLLLMFLSRSLTFTVVVGTADGFAMLQIRTSLTISAFAQHVTYIVSTFHCSTWNVFLFTFVICLEGERFFVSFMFEIESCGYVTHLLRFSEQDGLLVLVIAQAINPISIALLYSILTILKISNLSPILQKLCN